MCVKKKYEKLLGLNNMPMLHSITNQIATEGTTLQVHLQLTEKDPTFFLSRLFLAASRF